MKIVELPEEFDCALTYVLYMEGVKGKAPILVNDIAKVGETLNLLVLYAVTALYKYYNIMDDEEDYFNINVTVRITTKKRDIKFHDPSLGYYKEEEDMTENVKSILSDMYSAQSSGEGL
jgi:hypothetical protein